jgi:hypothetical protein
MMAKKYFLNVVKLKCGSTWYRKSNVLGESGQVEDEVSDGSMIGNCHFAVITLSRNSSF